MAYVKVLLISAVLVAVAQALNFEDVLGRLSALEKQTMALAKINTAQEKKIHKLADLLMNNEGNKVAVRKVRASGDGHVAFTAYLGHDLDSVAFNSTVVFDMILLNDGNGYNNATGVFTAPMDGVYYFTYFIGEIDDNQFNTMLTVNHINYVDALAEGISAGHNDQGGNAAVVRLSAGDQVQVKHRHVGSHLEGAPGVRLTTFTGYLLYATDSIGTGETIIG